MWRLLLRLVRDLRFLELGRELFEKSCQRGYDRCEGGVGVTVFDPVEHDLDYLDAFEENIDEIFGGFSRAVPDRIEAGLHRMGQGPE